MQLGGTNCNRRIGAPLTCVFVILLGLTAIGSCARALKQEPFGNLHTKKSVRANPTPNPNPNPKTSSIPFKSNASHTLASPVSTPPTSVTDKAALSPNAASIEQQRQMLQVELRKAFSSFSGTQPQMSLLVEPLGGGDPVFSYEPDARRIPASNAKLFTTTSAVMLLPGRYNFGAEISRSAKQGRLYLWGNGDPIVSRADFKRMAEKLKQSGIHVVKEILVDDSYWGTDPLAPGFEAFGSGAYYRPTVGAVNVDGNVVEIRVSALPGRKRPRIDVHPASDYVIVRKLARLGKAKRGRSLYESKIKVTVKTYKSSMWVVVSGTMGRKAPVWITKRAVADPALNAGFVLRRALNDAGIRATGRVRRGKRPNKHEVLVRQEHALKDILVAVNQHSDNLAAEALLRAMSFLREERLPETNPESVAESKQENNGPEHTDKMVGTPAASPIRGAWSLGLERMHRVLKQIGIESVHLENGSGLHRSTWATSRAVVTLLSKIYSDPSLREPIFPSLAVAGRSGTLGGRFRGTPASGIVHGKTGTLRGVLALSGYINPGKERPLVFSFLLNGRADRSARDHMDRIVTLLARYSLGLPMAEPSTLPAQEDTETPSTNTSNDFVPEGAAEPTP